MRNLLYFLFLLTITVIAHSKNISTGTINVNTATLYQLTLLPGVGKATAYKLLQARKHRKFSSYVDLQTRVEVFNRYLKKAENFISFKGEHQYDDPNKRSKKKKKLNNQSVLGEYTINKSIPIRDAKEIVLLTDGEFFNYLEKSLFKAKSEIWLSTFVFKITKNKHNMAKKIIDILEKVAKKGIEVSVLLEQSGYHKDLSDENRRLASFLKKSGIQFYFDSMDNTMHSKVVVIDREIVFLGSHNMTDSALRRNHEASLMIKSKTLASELVDYIKAITSEKDRKD